MRVSVLIPCFNEASTIPVVLSRIRSAHVQDIEIIVVDDGSTDGTRELLCGRLRQQIDRLILHRRNYGKGAAVRSAIAVMTGDVAIIQDADLEYHPKDYGLLLNPLMCGAADVVYGSRFRAGAYSGPWLHKFFNHVVSFLIRRVSRLPVTDVCAGYKALRANLLTDIGLTEKGFGIDAEITMKIAPFLDVRFTEVGIGYLPRRSKQGKKSAGGIGFELSWQF